MRTTIDIPTELMKKAKIKAAQEGISLKKLFIKSLKAELESEKEITSTQEILKKLRNMGSVENLDPEEPAFDGEIDPEKNFFFYVNEPESDSKKDSNDSA